MESDLWDKIRNFTLDDPEADFAFSDRLSRENGWPLAYTLRVIYEYKRFIYMICVANHPLTPSDQVDQAWHLHLIYTHSYWIDWCKNTLGKSIQHGPTKGGKNEKLKYNDWYEATKDLYQQTFNESPPEDIWPSSEIRFGHLNFTRVNTHKYWIIPKPLLFKKWKS